MWHSPKGFAQECESLGKYEGTTMEKGKDASIYLDRNDEIVDVLAAVEVEKKESEVNHHITRHLSNDSEPEK